MSTFMTTKVCAIEEYIASDAALNTDEAVVY
jgi:hypothetical protein